MESRAQWRHEQYKDIYRQKFELGGLVKEGVSSRRSASRLIVGTDPNPPPADIRRNPELVFPFWYNPANPQVHTFRQPPVPFMRQLHHVNPDLTVTWDPIIERWCVWALYKKKRLPWWMRPGRGQSGPGGWWIISVLEDAVGDPILVLDNRTLALLFYTNQEKYKAAGQGALMVEQAMVEEEKKNNAEWRDDAEYAAGEHYDYMAIKNIGKGSKFTEFHQGG